MSDALRETPRKLRLDLAAQRLEITWHDGHSSVFPAARLRFLCPCAACRGHAPGQVIPPSWDQVKDVTVHGASPVGGYAIQFEFSDGHATGIYAFDRLRESCPCAECAAGRGDPVP